MQHFFTPINTILTLCSIQGLALCIILCIKREGNKTANRILAGMVLYLSFSMIFHALSHADILPFLESHIPIIAALSIIYGPLLFFYIVAVTRYDYKFRYRDILHLLPLVLGFVIAMFSIFFISDKETHHKIESTIVFMSFFSFACYLVPANIRLAQYARMIKNNFSNLEKINLYWLRFLIGLLTSFWLVAFIFDTFLRMENWDIVWLVSSLVIFIISYFGLLQPAIFSGPVAMDDKSSRKNNKKYIKSSLTIEMAEKNRAALESIMNNEKLYLENNLSLSKLARHMGIPLHHLSQIINETIGLSFYDYINSQRIDEAKRMFTDPRNSHINISAIGFDAGFNSISAFNTAFKKFTGQTPSEYRAENR